jgi:hypothetical protein
MHSHYYIVFIIILILFKGQNLLGQDFGYFEVKHDNSFDIDRYSRESGAFSNPSFLIEWEQFELPLVEDGYHLEHYFTLNTVFQHVKMEGEIKDGKRTGKWILYNNTSPTFYSGEFKNNLKEGIWIGCFVNPNSDTICIDSIFFKNDLINGKRTEYFTSGLIFRETIYLNGLKSGTQYRYSVIDSTNQSFISEVRNYKNDTLDGISIDYSFLSPSDTVKIANYSNGKLNGLFFEKSFYSNDESYMYYLDDKLNGRLKKFY